MLSDYTMTLINIYFWRINYKETYLLILFNMVLEYCYYSKRLFFSISWRFKTAGDTMYCVSISYWQQFVGSLTSQVLIARWASRKIRHIWRRNNIFPRINIEFFKGFSGGFPLLCIFTCVWTYATKHVFTGVFTSVYGVFTMISWRFDCQFEMLYSDE